MSGDMFLLVVGGIFAAAWCVDRVCDTWEGTARIRAKADKRVAEIRSWEEEGPLPECMGFIDHRAERAQQEMEEHD